MNHHACTVGSEKYGESRCAWQPQCFSAGSICRLRSRRRKGTRMTTRWIVAGAVLLMGCEGRPKDKTELKGSKEKASYSIGFNVGSNLKKEKVDVDLDVLRQGIGDAMAGKPGLMNQQDH